MTENNKKKPAVKKTSTKKPTVKKTAVKKPAIKKTSTKKPVVKKPAVKKPVVKKVQSPAPKDINTNTGRLSPQAKIKQDQQAVEQMAQAINQQNADLQARPKVVAQSNASHTQQTDGEIMQRALADIIMLFIQSPLHRCMFISDLETTIIPPLRAKQYRLFKLKGKIIGLALWASISDEVQERFISGTIRLKPIEWSSGDNIWIMDIISPKGKSKLIMEELRSGTLAHKKFVVQKFNDQGESVPEMCYGDLYKD